MVFSECSRDTINIEVVGGEKMKHKNKAPIYEKSALFIWKVNF